MNINDELRAMRERVEANAHYEYATRSHTDRARLLDVVERVMALRAPVASDYRDCYYADGYRDAIADVRAAITEALDS